MRGTWQGSGTWKTSGPDFTALIKVGVLAGVVVGVAMVIVEFALVIAIVLSAVLVLAGGALAWWLLTARTRDARRLDVHNRILAEIEEARRLREMEAHQKAVEIARAGATQVHVTNTIDPAALLGAAFAGAERPYRAEVIRGAVER